MPFLFKRLVLFLSIAAALAADKEDTVFRPNPVASYPHRQTNDKVTVAADPYISGDKVHVAFGKLDPYDYGVLPVLVVIQNDSGKAVRLDHVQAVYNGPQGDKVEATPAGEVRYLKGPHQPRVPTGPASRLPIGKGKNPLNAWEIEGRAFAAKMLPAGQTASGFFYFQTGLQRGATLYLSGLADATTGHELFDYEIPLE
jgi:hypothetical protein